MNLDWLNDKSGNILITGCGGGYDIFTGLPLYFYLKEKKLDNKIFLANLSFTDENLLKEFKPIGNSCYEVDANFINKDIESSEYKLSKIINEPVYCFFCYMIKDFNESYQLFVKKYDIKTILICDGGCDSIFSGVEYDLGTPVEDMITLWAINKLNINTYLILLGADVDTYCDVKYDDMVMNFKQLKEKEAILSTIQLDKDMVCVQSYIDVLYKLKEVNSIVNCCILSSLEKQYGNYHHKLLGDRCRLGEFKITEETSKYYIFDFKKIINHILYLDDFDNYNTDDEIDEYISSFNRKFNSHWKNFNC